MTELSVVIPCCNEAGAIGRFETELYPALDGLGVSYEVLAVDDGSTDGTRAALEALAARKPLKILVHERNRGLGAALRAAFAAVEGRLVATLDADLTFHPRALANLLAAQKAADADLVSGSPFLSAEGAAGVPWTRRLPSLMLNAFYRGLFSRRFWSYTPMFRLYRRSELMREDLRAEGFEINAEIAARFIQRRLKLAEVPVTLSTRLQGVSKLNRSRELLRHAQLIWRLLSDKA